MLSSHHYGGTSWFSFNKKSRSLEVSLSASPWYSLRSPHPPSNLAVWGHVKRHLQPKKLWNQDPEAVNSPQELDHIWVVDPKDHMLISCQDLSFLVSSGDCTFIINTLKIMHVPVELSIQGLLLLSTKIFLFSKQRIPDVYIKYIFHYSNVIKYAY